MPSIPSLKTYRDPVFTYTDEYSGRQVEQLSNYRGHTHHLYFTDPCWIKDNLEMVVSSDRENVNNLYALNIDTRIIQQLTDYRGTKRLSGAYTTANESVYYTTDTELFGLNLKTMEQQSLFQVEKSAIGGSAFRIPGRGYGNADGRYLLFTIMEYDPEEKYKVSFAYSDFYRNFERKPLTKIVRMDTRNGEVEVIHEDRCFITHLNPSPTLPSIATFCHEGPWHRVEQRIWGLDIESGKVWKIRDQQGENLAIGHEYWFANGERLGFHGRLRHEATITTGDHIYGHIRWDGSDCVERRFPFHSTHFHSLDENLIVGDGSPAAVFTHQGVSQPFIQLFRWDGSEYQGPKILAYHRSTFNDQHCHPHPRFSPDGRHVIYSSDISGYANIYRVAVGNFDDLPWLTDEVRPTHT